MYLFLVSVKFVYLVCVDKMPKKNPQRTPPPEPENVSKHSRGASHKCRCINLWDEAEMVWFLQEYN